MEQEAENAKPIRSLLLAFGFPLIHILEDTRSAHAAADAHGDHPKFGLAASHFVEQLGG